MQPHALFSTVFRTADMARLPPHSHSDVVNAANSTLEVNQGQILSQSLVAIDGFLSQLPYKCHQNRVASVGFAPELPPGWRRNCSVAVRSLDP